MDIDKHIEAQKQMREAEWSVRTAKHTRMRELRKTDQVEEQIQMSLDEHLEALAKRRDAVASQKHAAVRRKFNLFLGCTKSSTFVVASANASSSGSHLYDVFGS